jgi:hypothetical protein
MPEIIDTPVVVELSPAGDARAFIWDRFEHTVGGQPQAIISRTHWWANDQSYGMKILNRIDTELWRVDASHKMPASVSCRNKPKPVGPASYVAVCGPGNDRTHATT